MIPHRVPYGSLVVVHNSSVAMLFNIHPISEQTEECVDTSLTTTQICLQVCSDGRQELRNEDKIYNPVLHVHNILGTRANQS